MVGDRYNLLRHRQSRRYVRFERSLIIASSSEVDLIITNPLFFVAKPLEQTNVTTGWHFNCKEYLLTKSCKDTKRFLCGLCIMAHGNLNNSMKAFDVFFKNVSAEAYERPSFGYQATNEIVQNLVQKGFIERDTLESIKLTQKGLDKCKEDCC